MAPSLRRTLDEVQQAPFVVDVLLEVSDSGATCTPEPVLDRGNHGQCVSTKAKSLSGKALAAWAKDERLIGYDCHYAA